MQDPTEKELDPIASPIFIRSVHEELREYDGMRVGQSRPCPGCDSTDSRKNGYQRAAKTFARLVTEDGFEEVGLEVQQYECRECGRSFQGDLSEHFYEGCEYAQPIVDLCRFHAETYSYNACERLLQRLYGIQVDRDTIKRYDELFDEPVARETTVIGGTEASVPFLAFLFGDGDADGPPFVFTSHSALW